MKRLLLAASSTFIFATFAGCSAPGSSSLDSDLNTIRAGYGECVNAIGADSPQCQALANGVHQIADQVGSAQTTAGRVKAEDEARHSMGY
jgi:hypothetical protein